jgi:hypothetical protein
MRYLIPASVVASLAITALPATAQADRSDCPRKLERSYSKHYRMVVNRHGTRAPGRNIRKHGMLVSWGRKNRHKVAFTAMCSELRRSRRQLKRLLAPPVYPTLERTAVPPPQRPAGVSSSGTTAGPVLEAIAQCESGGNPSTDTGNGFYGKYQFTLETWAGVGGSGNPAHASEAEQDKRAAILYSQAGAQPWPVCGQ